MNTPNQTRRTTQPPVSGPSLSPFPNSLRPSAFKVRPSYLGSTANYSPRDYTNSPLVAYQPSPAGSARSTRSTRILPNSATFSKPNPFEVLSAPAFDEFVDDVTSKIKRALAGPVRESTRLRDERVEEREKIDVFGEVKRIEDTEEVGTSVEELILQDESENEEEERIIEEDNEEEDEESSDDDNEVSIILQRELLQVKLPIISRSPSLEASLSPLLSPIQEPFTQTDLDFYINAFPAESFDMPFPSTNYEASPTPEPESQISVKSHKQPLFEPESASDDQSDHDQNYYIDDEDEDAEGNEIAVNSEISSYEDRLAGFELPNSMQPSQAFSPQVRYDTEEMEEDGENEYTGDEEEEREEEEVEEEETIDLPKPSARVVRDEVEVIELGSSSEDEENSNEGDQEEDSDAEGEYDDEEEEDEEDQLEESTAAFILPILPPSNIRRPKITGPPSGIEHQRLQKQQNISTSALLDESDDQESGEEEEEEEEDGEESGSGSAEEGSIEEGFYEEESPALAQSMDWEDNPRPSQDDRRSLPIQLEDEGETDEDGSGEEDAGADQGEFDNESVSYPSQEYLEDSDVAEEEYEEQESESLTSRIPYHLKGKGPEVDLDEEIQEDEDEDEEILEVEYNESREGSYSVDENPAENYDDTFFEDTQGGIESIVDNASSSFEDVPVEDEITIFDEYAALSNAQEEEGFEVQEAFSRDKSEDLDDMEVVEEIDIELQQEMEREMNEYETKSIAQLVIQQQSQQQQQQEINAPTIVSDPYTRPQITHLFELAESETQEDEILASEVFSAASEVSPIQAVVEEVLLLDTSDTEVGQESDPIVETIDQEILSHELEQEIEGDKANFQQISQEPEELIVLDERTLADIEVVVTENVEEITETSLELEAILPIAKVIGKISPPPVDHEINNSAQFDEQPTLETAMSADDNLEHEAFDPIQANEGSGSLPVDLESEISLIPAVIHVSEQIVVSDSSDGEAERSTHQNVVEDNDARGESSEPISYYGSEYDLDESLLATNYATNAIRSPPRVHDVFSAGEWDPTTPIRFGGVTKATTSGEELYPTEETEDTMMGDFEVSPDFANNFFEDVTLESFEQPTIASGSEEAPPTFNTGLERDLILPPGFLASLASGALDSTLASMPDNFFDESQSQPPSQSYSQIQTDDFNSLTTILPIEVANNSVSEVATTSTLSAQSELVDQFFDLPQSSLAPLESSPTSVISEKEVAMTPIEATAVVEVPNQDIEIALDEVDVLPSSILTSDAILEDATDETEPAAEVVREEEATDEIDNETVELSDVHIPSYVEPEVDSTDSFEILVPILSETTNNDTLSPTPPQVVEDVIEVQSVLEPGEIVEAESELLLLVASSLPESNLDASNEIMEEDESQELIVETFTSEFSPLPQSSATVQVKEVQAGVVEELGDVEDAEDVEAVSKPEEQDEEEESQELIVQALDIPLPNLDSEHKKNTPEDVEEFARSEATSPAPFNIPDPIIEDSTVQSGYTSDVDDFEEPLIITPVKGRSVDIEYAEQAEETEILEEQDSGDEIMITLLDKGSKKDEVGSEVEKDEDENMVIEPIQTPEIVEEAMESSEDELTLISTRAPRKAPLTSASQSSASLTSSSINQRNSKIKNLSPPVTRSPRRASPAVIESNLIGRRKSTRLAHPESNAPSTSSILISSPPNVSSLKRSRSSEIPSRAEATSSTPKRSRRNSVITRQSSTPAEESPPPRRSAVPQIPRARVHAHVNHNNLPREPSPTPSDPGNDSPANLRKSTRNKSTVNHVPITRSHFPSCAIVSPLAIETIEEFGIINLGPPGIIEEAEGIRLSGTSNEGIEDHQMMNELIREDDVRIALRRIVGVDILNEGVVEMLPREEQVEEEVDQLVEEELEQEGEVIDQSVVGEDEANPLRRSTRASGPFSPGKKRKGDELVGGKKKNKQKKERFSLN